MKQAIVGKSRLAGYMLVAAVLFCALSTRITMSQAVADSGVWVGVGEFAQINVFCTRVYRCGPSEDVLYDGSMKIEATPPELVNGVCSAGDGPVDSCNLCLTNQPAKECTWKLVPK